MLMCTRESGSRSCPLKSALPVPPLTHVNDRMLSERSYFALEIHVKSRLLSTKPHCVRFSYSEQLLQLAWCMGTVYECKSGPGGKEKLPIFQRSLLLLWGIQGAVG